MEVCTLKIIIITIININRNDTSRLSYWQQWRHIIFLCQKKVSTWNWGRAENSYCIYPVFNVRVILFLSLCSDLESETGDDSKIGSDDEMASVHDEEQSKDTNDVSVEGCSELAKRKLELEEEELKPYVKKSKVSKQERKTKLEKSIAELSDSFKDRPLESKLPQLILHSWINLQTDPKLVK